MIILTGTGRSGTSFMTLVLNDVYKLSMSSEPKNVLYLCKYLKRQNLDIEKNYIRALNTCLRSKTFNYLKVKHEIININRKDLDRFVDQRSVDGIIEGMFKYVSFLRKGQLHGYKDPLDLINMKKIQDFIPRATFIIMLRKPDAVASSTLKHKWGPTNIVAGAWDWKNRIDKALKDIINLKKGTYLFLKLEDLDECFDSFCEELDNFMFQIYGISKLELLKLKLNEYRIPSKKYKDPPPLVYKITNSTSNKLGYSFRKEYNSFFCFLESIPYFIIDVFSRIVNVIKRRFLSRNGVG